MDIRLQELLERIKKDGLDEANAEAQAVLAKAESERKAMLAQAAREAKALLENAKTEAERFEASALSALGQASRNLVLSFKVEIQKLFAAVIRKETEAAFDASVLKNALPAVLAGWAEKGTDDLTILIPPEALKKLESFFADKLAAELRRGLELKPFPALKAGFRILEKNGAAYYDFSAETVAALMSQYLNERLAGVMTGAVREG
jgi:V/A-type H+/Na+-transporting ATPase subunit E